MRLWTLHPKYLDPRGLVALWREGLLAQAVLAGATKGYRHHPQLQRFQSQPDPLAAIALYLRAVHDEATARGYNFDRSKLHTDEGVLWMDVSSGQLAFEWEHLLRKLRVRAPALASAHEAVSTPLPHPSFTVVEGPVASWEIIGP